LSKIETELSSEFVDATIREFGNKIWIEKQCDSLRAGTPDIYASINGLFIPIECKRAIGKGNSILSHTFTKIQKRQLKILAYNAFPIGLIFSNSEKRWILPLHIREDGNMSLDQYLSLPIFSWREVYDAASRHRQDRSNWR